MAGVHKTRTAKGPVYKIEVFVGMMNGRQKKRYKTFKPPKGVSESRADQLAYQEAARFEDMVRNGDNFDSNQTFADFARYVIDCKKVSGKRNNTLRSYEYMLKRVLPALGAIRVKDLRAAHLTEFYAQLRKPGTRHDKAYAVAKETLVSECRKQGFSQEKLAKKTGLAINTLTEVYRGRHVSTKTAQLIADALGKNCNQIFDVHMNNEKLSDKSIVEYHRFIHTILDRAVRERIVQRNVADDVDPPRYRKKPIQAFGPEEIQQILDAVDEKASLKWRAMTYFFLGTGCRRGEVAGLKWEDIDFESGIVTIQRSLSYSPEYGICEGPTKTEDLRVLRLPQETLDMLEKLKEQQDIARKNFGDEWLGKGYVFTGDRGEPTNPSSITSFYADFGKKNNIPGMHPHLFRHSVASVLIANNIDVVSVAAQLGHSRVSTTTDIYAHALSIAKAKNALAISSIIFGHKPNQNT